MAPVGWIARAAEPPRRGRACWRKPVIQGTVETFGGVQLYSDPNYLVIQIHTTKCLLRFKLPTLPGNSTYLPGDLGSRRRRFKYRILKKNDPNSLIYLVSRETVAAAGGGGGGPMALRAVTKYSTQLDLFHELKYHTNENKCAFIAQKYEDVTQGGRCRGGRKETSRSSKTAPPLGDTGPSIARSLATFSPLIEYAYEYEF
ncbi:hypothetical protein T492DRAFT_842549 [Pavlovales sp. CCMP2436]|nr:hypothetical protein T492DRAFT_842549 [Pavlovales sp. CCMP2436]